MEKGERINQEQFFNFVTSDDLGWQTIIYDLINTEQLDPWDINLEVLANKYIEVIQAMEEADFFISSKVLLACSLLLRLKSEILINSYIEDLNKALYGEKEGAGYEFERIEIDENDLPILTPKSPMARHKKVTLQELLNALGQAIETETRRIKREIKGRQAEKSALTVMPRDNHIPLKVRIKSIFGLVQKHVGEGNNHMKFFHLAPSREERLASFVPVLHLSNDGKLYLWQDGHFEDIHMSFEMHHKEKKVLEEEVGFSTGEEIEEIKDSESVEEKLVIE